MRGKVVAEEMDRQARLDLAVDLVQEVAEVDGAVTGRQVADHPVGGGVECSGQTAIRAAGVPMGDSQTEHPRTPTNGHNSSHTTGGLRRDDLTARQSGRLGQVRRKDAGRAPRRFSQDGRKT
jgi:hypothetical protein